MAKMNRGECKLIEENDESTDCPFCREDSRTKFNKHQSTFGCKLESSEDGQLIHHFKSIRLTFLPDKSFLFENMGFGDHYTWQCYPDGRASFFTYLEADSKHISSSIITPLAFWLTIKNLLSRFDHLIWEEKRLFLTKDSMCDVAFSPSKNKMRFLRPVLFHTDENAYYSSVRELLISLYACLSENVKRVGKYHQTFSTGEARAKRNLVCCDKEKHKRYRILKNTFPCVCDKQTKTRGGDKQGERRCKNELSWCYSSFGEVGSVDVLDTSSFACVFSNSKQKSALHYELFDRNLDSHLLFCCPDELLCAEWYEKIHNFADKCLHGIKHRSQFVENLYKESAI